MQLVLYCLISFFSALKVKKKITSNYLKFFKVRSKCIPKCINTWVGTFFMFS